MGKEYQTIREYIGAQKTITTNTELPILRVGHKPGRLRSVIIVLNNLARTEIHVELDGQEILGLTPDKIISDGAGKLSILTGVSNSSFLFCHRNTSGYYGVTINLNELPAEFNDELHVFLRNVTTADDYLMSAFVLYDLKT